MGRDGVGRTGPLPSGNSQASGSSGGAWGGMPLVTPLGIGIGGDGMRGREMGCWGGDPGGGPKAGLLGIGIGVGVLR